MANMIIDEAKNAIATFVFAHGAGAGKNHQFMTTVSELLVQRGINVLRFDFPYMVRREEEGRKFPPNRMPVLVQAYQDIVDSLDDSLTKPLFIGGKSMGSRVAMTLLGENTDVATMVKGAICLGYPFHPPKKPDNLRLAPLEKQSVPTLICQGDRDTLGNKAEIEQYQLAKHYQVEYLPDGDHDFKPRVRSGHTHEQHIKHVVDTIEQFIRHQLEENSNG